MGIGSALLYLPWVALAETLDKLFRLQKFPIVEFFVSLTNAFITAWILVLLVRYLAVKGFSDREAVFTATLCGFATLLFSYSKTCQREPVQALCLLGMIVFTEERKYLIAGLFAGFGILTKAFWIVPVLPVLIYSLWKAYTSRRVLRFVVPVVCAAVLVAFYQWYCFANPLTGGYSSGVEKITGVVWSTPLLKGIWIQLLSVNEGLFFLNPLLFLCFFGLIQSYLKKRASILDLAILTSFLFQLCTYARWFNPLGGECLGPRYLIVLIPALFLFLKREVLFPKAALGRAVISLLVVFSFVSQFIHAAVKPQQYWTLHSLAEGQMQKPHWESNFEYFAQKILFKGEKYQVLLNSGEKREYDLKAYRSLQGFNFWWLHMMRYIKNA